MTVNIFLALLAPLFALLLTKTRPKALKTLLFILWLLFVPNTIYVLTDLEYLPSQLATISTVLKPVLIAQYIILTAVGLVAYFYAFKKTKRIIQNLTGKFFKTSIFLFNYLIALAVSIGKLQRLESWDIILHPFKVVNSSLHNIASIQTALFILFFGTLVNIIYFSFNRR